MRDYAEDIVYAFGIDISRDDSDNHPSKLCEACQVVIERCAKAAKSGLVFRPMQKAVGWQPHTSEESCFASETYSKRRKGGRHPAKRSKCCGRPKLNSVEHLTRFLSSIAPPSRPRPAELRRLVVGLVDPDVLSQLTCFICLDIVDQPVRTKCDHLACLNCLVGQYHTLQSEDDWICSSKVCETVFHDSSKSIPFRKAGSF